MVPVAAVSSLTGRHELMRQAHSIMDGVWFKSSDSGRYIIRQAREESRKVEKVSYINIQLTSIAVPGLLVHHNYALLWLMSLS